MNSRNLTKLEKVKDYILVREPWMSEAALWNTLEHLFKRKSLDDNKSMYVIEMYIKDRRIFGKANVYGCLDSYAIKKIGRNKVNCLTKVESATIHKTVEYMMDAPHIEKFIKEFSDNSEKAFRRYKKYHPTTPDDENDEPVCYIDKEGQSYVEYDDKNE